MILIIGGAYQGKLDYAKRVFGIADGDVCICGKEDIDFSKRCICEIQAFTYTNDDPVQFFKESRGQWKDSVLICRDIFCGVVPMGTENRVWRQKTGRLCQYLAGEATQVIRIFCGLEQRLK